MNASKQPLWEQPLHIIPKPVPRHEPTIPSPCPLYRWDWGRDILTFLNKHMEPIENEL
jgi:hypothetical protein